MLSAQDMLESRGLPRMLEHDVHVTNVNESNTSADRQRGQAHRRSTRHYSLVAHSKGLSTIMVHATSRHDANDIIAIILIMLGAKLASSLPEMMDSADTGGLTTSGFKLCQE